MCTNINFSYKEVLASKNELHEILLDNEIIGQLYKHNGSYEFVPDPNSNYAKKSPFGGLKNYSSAEDTVEKALFKLKSKLML